MTEILPPVEEVTDPKTMQDLEAFVLAAISRFTLNCQYSIGRRWHVVPVASDFVEEESSTLYDLLTKENLPAIHAIVVDGYCLSEMAELRRVAFCVPRDRQKLREFADYCRFFLGVALMPNDKSWCILLTADSYYLVAGPKRIIEAMCGNENSMQSLQKAFFDSHELDLEALGDQGLGRVESWQLRNVHDRCHFINAALEKSIGDPGSSAASPT